MKFRWAYIGVAFVALLLWFNLALEPLTSLFGGVFGRFIVFNLFLAFVLYLAFKGGLPKDVNGFLKILGYLLITIAADIVLPELHVSSSGVVAGSFLGDSASDYVIGLLWQWIGFKGLLLYNLTYVLSPLILFVAGVKLGGKVN